MFDLFGMIREKGFKMNSEQKIYKIIGEFNCTFNDGDFCKLTPVKKLSQKETIELFEYLYNNVSSHIPIQVFNTFGDINYFDWIKRINNERV